MSERDRLAADLKEALKADLATGGGNRWPNEMFLATFLHALGWTRLDEERLMRALYSHWLNTQWLTTHCGNDPDCSAAIAKAYREDTG